jgi:hypothetical protein
MWKCEKYVQIVLTKKEQKDEHLFMNGAIEAKNTSKNFCNFSKAF